MQQTSHKPAMLRVALRVLNEPVAFEAPQPESAVRLDECLPFWRALDDRIIDVAVRRAQADGAVISCCNGCAACCKAQPVPVTPPEALALARLVEALPEPRRSDVPARFAERVARLRAAGLADVFLSRGANLSKAEARTVAERYFGMGLVCPFLENDSCSIHADRPFVCRQYLVTSPAALCSDPFNNPVKPLPVPVAAAGATLETAEEILGTPQYTVPLVLALEAAEVHRADLERTFEAKSVHERWLRALTNPSREP